MSRFKSPLVLFLLILLLIALVALFRPEEKSLGSNVRIVYLHGAWVLTAEVTLIAAGLMGVSAISNRRPTYHRWSAALGQAGIVFWVMYLPISLWAMQANWNGLFLAEPRFRLALIFAVTGVLLQLGLWFIKVNWLTSLVNILFIVVLRTLLTAVEDVLHPSSSPIFSSGNNTIIGFFIVMILLSLMASYFLTRSFLNLTEQAG